MAKVAALSEELRALDAELRSLGGGGDAAIAPAAVYCSVCPAPVRSATVGTSTSSRHSSSRGDGRPPTPAVALLPGGDGVAVADPASDDAPQTLRRYRMTAASDSGDAPDTLAVDVVDWLMRGFDALVLTHGQSGTGKSHVTFGGGGMGAVPSPIGGFDKPGVLTKLFRGVFTRAAREEAAWRLAEDARVHRGEPENAADEVRHRFAVSCWEMAPDGRIVDLLDPTGDARGLSLGELGDRYGDYGAVGAGAESINHHQSTADSFRACAVEVSTAEEAEAVLAHSRRASANWTLPRTRPGTETYAPGPWVGAAARVRANRAHAFVRLVVVKEPSGVVSELHVCDLVGARPLGLAEVNDGLGESMGKSNVEGDRDRRGAARQLLALSRVVDELSRRSPASDGSDEVQDGVADSSVRDVITAKAVRGARDSRLTMTLAPLMASGAKTFMLCTVSPLPDDHLDTLNTLRVAMRCARIDAACVKRRLAPEHRTELRRRFVSLREAVVRADAASDAALVSGVNAGVVPEPEPRASAAERAEWGERDDVVNVVAKDAKAADDDDAAEPLLSPIKAARIPAGLLPGRTPPRVKPQRSNLMREFMEDVPDSFRGQVGEPEEETQDDTRGGTVSRTNATGESLDEGESSAELGRRLASLKDQFVALYDTVTVDQGASTKDTDKYGGTSVDAQRDAHRLRRTPPTSPRAKYAGNRRVKWPDDSDRYSDAHDRYFDEKENVTVTDQKDGPGKRRPPAPSRGPIPTNPEALTLEVEEQRRRYDALLGMLHAEEGARLRAEERAASTAHDAAERVATAEASAQDAKRVAVEAKARVRALEDGTDFAEVFARYEMDVDALDRECARLREEAFLAHMAVQGDVDLPGPHAENSESESSRVINNNEDVQRRMGALKRALRKSEEKVDELEQTVGEFRRRERLMDLHSRQHDDQLRRLQAHERQIVALRAELQRSQLSAARSEARREEAQRDAALARARESGLREDSTQLAAEVERRGRKMRAYENRVDELERGRVGRPGGTKATVNSSDFATHGDYDAIQSELELRDIASQLRRAVPPGASSRADRLFDALYGELDTLLTRVDAGGDEGGGGYAGMHGSEREQPWRDYVDPRRAAYGDHSMRSKAPRKPSSPSPERLDRAMAAHVQRMERSRSPGTSPRKGRPASLGTDSSSGFGSTPRARSLTPPHVVPKRLTLTRPRSPATSARGGVNANSDNPLALAAEEAAHRTDAGWRGGARLVRSPSRTPPGSPRASNLPDYASAGGYVPGQHSAARAAARASGARTPTGERSQPPSPRSRPPAAATPRGHSVSDSAARALEAVTLARSPDGSPRGARSPRHGNHALAPPPTDDRRFENERRYSSPPPRGYDYGDVLGSYAETLGDVGTYAVGAPPSSLARSPPGSPRPFYPSGPTEHQQDAFR